MVKPAPGPATEGRSHGIGARLGVAAVDVDDPIGRHRRIGHSEFLTLVDERSAAQRVDHQQHCSRPGRAETGPTELGPSDTRPVEP